MSERNIGFFWRVFVLATFFLVVLFFISCGLLLGEPLIKYLGGAIFGISFESGYVSLYYLPSASISIVYPENGAIVYSGTNQLIRVYEEIGGEYIDNVTLKINYDGLDHYYVMTNETPDVQAYWNYSFSIPVQLEPQLISVTAEARNGSNFLSSDTIYLILTRYARFEPQIVFLCGYPTYVEQNTSAIISSISVLDTLFAGINLTFFAPNGTSFLISELANASVGKYSYNHNFSSGVSSLGEWIAQVVVEDVNFQTGSRNVSIFSVVPENVNWSASGGTLARLLDVCHGGIVAVNNTLWGIEGLMAPGKYHAVFTTLKPNITLYNASLNSSVSIALSFQDVSEDTLAAPNNTFVLDEWLLSSSVNFTNATLVYNYSSIVGSIVDERNLRLYKCSQVNCILEEVPIVIDVSNNIVSANVSSLGYFVFGESSRASTIVTIITGGSGPGGGGGGGGGGSLVTREVIKEYREIALLDIIVPPSLSLYLNDSVYTKVILRNVGNASLEGISLVVKSSSSNLSPVLDKTFFVKLEPGEEAYANLSIKSSFLKQGIHFINISALVSKPLFNKTAYIFFEVLDKGREGGNERLTNVILFVKDLFKRNPECLELSELIDQAQASLEKGEFEKAKALLDGAAEACRNLVASYGRKPSKTEEKKQFDFLVPFLIASIITGLFALYWLHPQIHLFSKKKKKKDKENIVEEI